MQEPLVLFAKGSLAWRHALDQWSPIGLVEGARLKGSMSELDADAVSYLRLPLVCLCWSRWSAAVCARAEIVEAAAERPQLSHLSPSILRLFSFDQPIYGAITI